MVLRTTLGDLDIELWPKEAPKAVRNFVQVGGSGREGGPQQPQPPSMRQPPPPLLLPAAAPSPLPSLSAPLSSPCCSCAWRGTMMEPFSTESSKTLWCKVGGWMLVGGQMGG